MNRHHPLVATALVVGLLLASVVLFRSGGGSSAQRAVAGSAADAPYESDLVPASVTTGSRGPATALDPGLVAAFGRAQAAAAEAGHHLVINSGYRTPERQQELLDEEIAERGSFEEANRWVFTPERSMHVQGLAIDVGDGGAADWLEQHGAAFGLCHTLEWEWWHFEWRERWEDAAACPPPARDPSEAPGR